MIFQRKKLNNNLVVAEDNLIDKKVTDTEQIIQKNKNLKKKLNMKS